MGNAFALIDDHTLALQLAELAQTQATHEELKQLGAQTETALTAELTQLNSWLALSVAAHADDVAQLRLWLEQWYGEGADEAYDGTDGTDEMNGTNGISTGIDVGVGGDGASRGGLSDRVRGLSSRIGG